MIDPRVVQLASAMGEALNESDAWQEGQVSTAEMLTALTMLLVTHCKETGVPASGCVAGVVTMVNEVYESDQVGCIPDPGDRH